MRSSREDGEGRVSTGAKKYCGACSQGFTFVPSDDPEYPQPMARPCSRCNAAAVAEVADWFEGVRHAPWWRAGEEAAQRRRAAAKGGPSLAGKAADVFLD